MLRIQDLASRRNGQTLLNGVTLDVPDGQTVLLTGDAGGGKNALLRIVSGLEKYSRGTIVFDDLPTQGHPAPLPFCGRCGGVCRTSVDRL